MKTTRLAGTPTDARLQALRRYKILDTSREHGFDSVVEEAARECGTPIALVSLVDSNRQWFKAELGMGVRETDMTRSICAKAIEHEGVFVIPDTMQDPRVDTNPLVIGDPNIRFYAGAPLLTPDGHALGMVCVLDHQPRSHGITPAEAAVLTRLAAAVMSQLEARLARSSAQTAQSY
ncbi:MAG: GAF domain-containing protein [Oxalobacteraceae bacterium]|nr:MAG: GAF domain-containing protein [Oxalobacteraceae bacterium]